MGPMHGEMIAPERLQGAYIYLLILVRILHNYLPISLQMVSIIKTSHSNMILLIIAY